MKTDPIVDRWYWVTEDNETWFPAKWLRIGFEYNWSNEDTWEDFHKEIIDWVLIPAVDELKQVK